MGRMCTASPGSAAHTPRAARCMGRGPGGARQRLLDRRGRSLQPDVRCLEKEPQRQDVPTLVSGPTGHRQLVGPRFRTDKHKEIFSGSGVRRFTGGSRPEGHLPRLIYVGFRPLFSTIRDPQKTPSCASPLCAPLALVTAPRAQKPLRPVRPFRGSRPVHAAWT
jgi:hypothetical protein